MSTIPLEVKWGKESYDLQFVVASGVKGLKSELEDLTGVPSDRMKLMAKSKGLWKGVLKDDLDLGSIDFTGALSKTKGQPLQLLLMGSATKLAAPKTKTVFLEDLPPEEVAKVQEPSGMINLGNTCYLNSVVQCLRAVSPLRKGLERYSATQNNQNTLFLTALRDLYTNLDRTADPVPPANFVRLTKMTFPQFNQTGPQGQPMQQDAEEFYSGLLTVAANIDNSSLEATTEELQGSTNLVDSIFGIIMEETLTCDESHEEPPVTTKDLHRKLVCNIQGGQGSTTNVGHIYEGLTLGLEGKIEKHSDLLGRNAMWTRKQRIARLPPVVVVQFGRFYWKLTPDSQDHTGVKCKIMKKVAFGSTLDIYDFCTDKVKQILKGSRDQALKEDEERIQKKLEGKDADEDVEMNEEDDELKAALALSMESTPVGPGLPAHFQGHYELFAAVTHKGRDADGGHYMGWVKADTVSATSEKIGDTDDLNEDWFVFNDDEVSPCKTEDILKLQGGGDYDMSYLNFYRAKK